MQGTPARSPIRWNSSEYLQTASWSSANPSRREVREETGLTVEPVALTGVYKNMARGIIALVFRCNVVSGHLTLNDEVSGFQWATPEEVKAMADEAFAVHVLDALTDQLAPAVRHHDGVHVT